MFNRFLQFLRPAFQQRCLSELLLRPEAMFLWAGGHDARSVVADPLFVDAARMDFRLQVASPALSKLGFEPWNYSDVGPVGAVGAAASSL